MKRTLLAIGTAAALVVAAVPTTSANAQRWGWHGGWNRGFSRGFVGPRFGFRAGPRFGFRFARPWGAYAFAGCSWHRVWTPFGWRLRRWC